VELSLFKDVYIAFVIVTPHIVRHVKLLGVAVASGWGVGGCGYTPVLHHPIICFQLDDVGMWLDVSAVATCGCIVVHILSFHLSVILQFSYL
jgi:hypothetical protein